MKRFLSMLLCFVMLIGMLPAIPFLSADAATVKVPTTIAPAYTGAGYVWYNGNGYTESSDMYIHCVAEGADDVGSLHIYQKDGVVGAEDMRIYLSIDSVPAGTYTLQYNIKGSDLGITTLNDACRFYLNNEPGVTTQFRNLAGAKSVSQWTTLSEAITTTNQSDVFILGISKYVSGIDCYVDNVKLMDASGKDLLNGAGNFYAEEEYTPGSEPLMELESANPSSAYNLTEKKWTAMYPAGQPDASTWPQWDSTHYGEIVAAGNKDAGALHLVSAAGKNTGVAFGAGMTAGETYTLGLWAKGTSNSGRVLAHYANGDPVIIATAQDLSASWAYYEMTFTAGIGQINLVASDWGVTDIYIDNITLKGSDGVDLLSGYGDFCIGEADSDVVISQIYPEYPGVYYAWYNGNGFTAFDGMYIEIVEQGADDAGAIHIFQTDSVVAAEDMRVYLRTDRIPAGTYTLQYNIKGSDLGITTLNDVCRFYLNGDSGATTQFRNLAGSKTVSDWTALSETVTTSADSDYIILGISKYVSGIDCYVDNVKLLDESGDDLLLGAGNFCTAAEEEPGETEPEAPELPEIGETVPEILYDYDPQTMYKWYNYNNFTATKDMHIEIVREGADDVGALHVYQTDGVTGTEDMRLRMNTANIPEGTYTLKMKVKGKDLGNTDTANACRFYTASSADQFPQIRNLAGAKTVNDWTEFTQTVDTVSAANNFALSISKYVNGADFYVDNLQLLDENGNDVLCGAGNFCYVYGGENAGLPTEGLFTLDTNTMCSAYTAPRYVWTPMYPAGTPDSSTWPAWDNSHFAEISPVGYRDRGSLRLKSASYKNTAVAIGVDMVVGETYTLGLWAKGVSNSGRVLCQYANGNMVIVAGSTALSNQWTYYESVFTAELPQINLLATDWGITDIYLDHITLVGSDGVDLLKGYGDFCEEEYRLEDPHYLLSFNDAQADTLSGYVGQTAVAGASDPTLILNETEAEDGKGLQATWSYDGTNPAYLHRYIGTVDTWAKEFAGYASQYPYLRMWVNNPSHIPIDIRILLSGENTQNYFDASKMKLIRRDGTEIYGETNGNSISVPKQFAGWLAIPLSLDNLCAAEGYTTLISDFAKVTQIQLEVEKIPTSGEGDSSTYYYVLDDICLSFQLTGKKQSTDDGNEYADYDLSVKGEGQIKNVIFLIGDGMGYGTLDAARLDRESLYLDAITENGGVAGSVCTTNLYGDITDSAAAGTALATGYLTKNTVLGLTENLEPVMNLGEYMKQLGKKLGLVTTTYVLDATPAAFAAHTDVRGNFTAIAKDFLALGVDVVQGGGRSYLTETVADENGNAKTLIELAQSQYGYTYAKNLQEMNAVTSGKLWGIYQEENMPWVSENSTTDPTLAQMTTKSLELLESEDGFFLMVEGSKIDLAGHSNSAEDTRLETLAFDDAIKVAMDYADTHPGTLVIITADHETGGVRVAQDGTISYYTTSHTDELVPYYAYGTGAEYFRDLTVNTQLNYAIRRATMGSNSVGASTVATDAQLTDTQDLTVTTENGIITYTGVEKIASLEIPDSSAAYAVVKYRTDAVNMVGSVDEGRIYYAGDGKWHISDIITLTAGDAHTFQPISYVRGDNYNSIDIAGKSVEIDWVGLFDSYESAAAFQADAALTGSTPMALNGLSMALGDNLDMNFYVAVDETNVANTRVQLDGETILLTPEALDDATGNYKFSVELAAAQMTDTVTFTLMVDETVIETGTYSVRQYADAILAGTYDETVKAMVRSMLHYGAAAQTYFDYLPEQLANEGLDEPVYEPVPGQAETAMSAQGSIAGVRYYGASLLFRSETAVRFYFEAAEVADCTFTANGAVCTPVEKSDGMYYVEIDGINPQELGHSITLTVTNGSETITVIYGPMNYIVRMSTYGSANLKALLLAMYNYHLAATQMA